MAIIVLRSFLSDLRARCTVGSIPDDSGTANLWVGYAASLVWHLHAGLVLEMQSSDPAPDMLKLVQKLLTDVPALTFLLAQERAADGDACAPLLEQDPRLGNPDQVSEIVSGAWWKRACENQVFTKLQHHMAAVHVKFGKPGDRFFERRKALEAEVEKQLEDGRAAAGVESEQFVKYVRKKKMKQGEGKEEESTR